MIAARTLLKNMSRMAVTSAIPTTRFSWTVSVVRSIKRRPVIIGDDPDAVEQLSALVQFVDLGKDAL